MSTLRLRPPSQAAALPPLEDDNLLSEILLRLPPQPSSLPRASLVCKRWRCLVSDPGFCRRFRLHHRRNPPILGFFQVNNGLSFVPSLKAPDRISPERFSLRHEGDGGRIVYLGCRHGLVLVFLRKSLQLLVWDPVASDQHRIAVPLGFDTKKSPISGAVFRAAVDAQHFQVALVGNSGRQMAHAAACVYSSETGVWGNLVTTPHQSDDPAHCCIAVDTIKPAVLVGASLHWLLTGDSHGILEFDMDRQRLAVVPVPVNRPWFSHYSMIRADGGGLGFLFLSGTSAEFWERRTNCDGVASWALRRTIGIDKLLRKEAEEAGSEMILGFAEGNNVVLFWTIDGHVLLHLESLQLEKLLGTNLRTHYHSFECVYTTERGIGGGHDKADLLHNTVNT